MTREIPLSRGYVALVDDEDFDRLAQFKWSARIHRRSRRLVYAARNAEVGGKRVAILMHREILGGEAGLCVDHRDGDGLNNRRDNLRPSTVTENNRNRGRPLNSTTGYKGVSAERGRYRAQIQTSGAEARRLGTFSSPIIAARAYDLAAVKHHGEFARLNFSPARDWLFPHECVGQWPPVSGGSLTVAEKAKAKLAELRGAK